jgi:hypothetical protein
MNKKLFNYILSKIKAGIQLKFELECHSPQEGPVISGYDEDFFSKDTKSMFEDWVHLTFIEDLIGYELYNGGDFEFCLLENIIQIKGTSNLWDINDDYIKKKYSIDDILTEEVLKVLFNIDDVKQINTEDISLELEFEYNYESGEWTIGRLEDSHHYINGLSDFDFSTINLSKLKNLLYQNVKEFNDDDHLMQYSDLEYQKDVKLISVSSSFIIYTDTISYTIPVLQR